jgi:phosphate transport system permease protein
MEAQAPLTLRASGQLRRRQIKSRAMGVVAVASATLAVTVLAIVVITVARRGIAALNLAFFTQSQPVGFVPKGGGVLFAIVGSAIVVAIATAIAVPLGVLVAIYISEFASPRVARFARLVLDITNGIPTIVIGLFLFVLWARTHGPSGLAASVALAIIMIPLIARATEEVLLLVPSAQREASLAMGVSRWRTTVSVVVPSAFGGIITGTTLAVARAMGETAPLLFLSSVGASSNHVSWNPLHPLLTLTLTIFEYSDQADPAFQAKAWAAAFVLMVFVLVTSLTAKLALARYRKKLGG